LGDYKKQFLLQGVTSSLETLPSLSQLLIEVVANALLSRITRERVFSSLNLKDCVFLAVGLYQILEIAYVLLY
jgi:hypothetical protein